MICRKCKIEKTEDQYQNLGAGRIGKSTRCKACDKTYQREWSLKNRDSINAKSRANSKVRRIEKRDYYIQLGRKYYNKRKDDPVYRQDIRNKANERYKNLTPEKKQSLLNKVKQYKLKNIQSIKDKAKHRLKNDPKYREKVLKANNLYRLSNPEKIKELRRNWEKKKRKEDPLFKLRQNMKTYMRIYLKKRGIIKKCKLSSIIGVDFETVKKHIENQFKKGMTWENYGQWHIDHKIPLASGKTEEEIKLLFHYRNIQPMWAKENLAKRDKILPIQVPLAL